MKKEDKEILRHLVKKELNLVKEEEEEVIFPAVGFLKSMDVYEEKLKELLKDLK